MSKNYKGVKITVNYEIIKKNTYFPDFKVTVNGRILQYHISISSVDASILISTIVSDTVYSFFKCLGCFG